MDATARQIIRPVEKKDNPIHLDALSNALAEAKRRHIEDGKTIHVYMAKGKIRIRTTKPQATRVWTFSGGDMLLRIRDIATAGVGC